ncbi:hypothetical protein PR048_006125 [Dryococelus australis]|uniref:DDE Tnp4 domain-containing protein n=1 Tax=Dryococelus australis TaxID=614101 RepID=A0ABQ9IAN7_9NEOP|nr:hypothetical protein PR048_006125 [Dryococelus australis]
MDGSHVKVKVRDPNKQNYCNVKCDYSEHFQVIVDGNGKFIDIFAGYPGSVYDSRVLRASPIYGQALMYPPPGYFLLGDGGYPLLEKPVCSVTPYRNPEANNHAQNMFNTCHSRARSVVERAFGIVKARW